jgi:hypothetical protein
VPWFLSRKVANGAAADDTRATYGVHVATWLARCRGTELELASATVEDVEDYRDALIVAGCLQATVAIKLTLVRRFYDAAIRAGLRPDNPAAGVRAADPHRWYAALALLRGAFTNTLDATVVTLAIPTVQHDLGATFTAIRRVVASYQLAFAALLITAGRSGDSVGPTVWSWAGWLVSRWCRQSTPPANVGPCLALAARPARSSPASS